jgi:hypothetical protein
MDVLKYTLPEDIIRKKTKATIQILINIKNNDFLVFAQE